MVSRTVRDRNKKKVIMVAAVNFPAVNEVVARGVDKRLHMGIQLSLSCPGQEFDLAFGEQSPGVQLSPNHTLFWLSAAKPLAAVAILQLQERQLLHIQQPLSEFLPKWKQTGPAGRDITLWHLLTHTSPLQEIPTGWPEASPEQILETICQAQLKTDWPVGERAAYLPSTSWFLLGAIIERCSGLTFPDYLQHHILTPAGMSQTRCVAPQPGEHSETIALYDRQQGELQPSLYLERLLATTASPGSSFRGPARDLRLFYQTLNSDLLEETAVLLQPESIRPMVTRQRTGLFDETLQHQVDYGLGVIIDSKQYGSQTVPYGFGEASSTTTFGHGGSQCAIGFADPERRRAVVLIANGRPGEGQHQRRFRELLAALEQDLQDLL